MKNIVIISMLILMVSACGNTSNKSDKPDELTVVDYTSVINHLERMRNNDQSIMFSHTGDETKTVKDSLTNLLDEVIRANTDSIKKLFNEHGFLTFDKVGETGSQNFWLLVQHADHDVAFQEEVLKSMKSEVKKKNASGPNFAYLTDRVLKNKGEKQLYGTQLKYLNDFWIISQPTKDSLAVNERRKEIGLSTIEEYWNSAMESHYTMNKAVYENQGLKGPRKYKLKN